MLHHQILLYAFILIPFVSVKDMNDKRIVLEKNLKLKNNLRFALIELLIVNIW